MNPNPTMSTPYHSQYWAHALALQGSGGNIESLSRSIANARVDLNQHQIDATLFALHSLFRMVRFLPTKLVWEKLSR